MFVWNSLISTWTDLRISYGVPCHSHGEKIIMTLTGVNVVIRCVPPHDIIVRKPKSYNSIPKLKFEF